MTHRALMIAAAGALGVLGAEALLAVRGVREVFVDPPTEPRRLGDAGDPLVFVVVGDSTAAGSGVPYERGIAVAAG
jgi:hypothetical protein